jgi:tetratricopeptide (TPR) repeat protein
MRLVGLTWFLVAALLSQTAFADAKDNKAKARDAYRLGTQHYDLGEYREALQEFKEAYRKVEDPSFLFNIAQCHRQLGDKQEAIRFYRTYLIKAGDAPNREEVNKMVAKLEKAIADEQAVKTSPPSGTIGSATDKQPPVEVKQQPEEVKQQPAPVETREQPPVAQRPKLWWIGVLVGGVAVVGLAVGLGVGLGLSQNQRTAEPSTALGTFEPPFTGALGVSF